MNKSLQRDPTRTYVGTYIDLGLAAKIETVIEGQTVPRRKRKQSSGRFGRKQTSYRRKTIGDFLVECAESKVKKVIPSQKAKSWAKKVLTRNKARRMTEDIKHKEGSRWGKSRVRKS